MYLSARKNKCPDRRPRLQPSQPARLRRLRLLDALQRQGRPPDLQRGGRVARPLLGPQERRLPAPRQRPGRRGRTLQQDSSPDQERVGEGTPQTRGHRAPPGALRDQKRLGGHFQLRHSFQVIAIKKNSIAKHINNYFYTE